MKKGNNIMNIRNIIKESIDGIVLEKELENAIDKGAIRRFCEMKIAYNRALATMDEHPGMELPENVDIAVRGGRYVKYIKRPDIYEPSECYAEIAEAIKVLQSYGCSHFDIFINGEEDEEMIGSIEA